MKLFAAGSLRAVLTELLRAYEAQGGGPVVTVFGPSGKLKERIEQGDIPDLFVPADLKLAKDLARTGQLRAGEPYVRNSLCLMAAPGVKLEQTRLVDMLLDPAMKLGTSTPGADPAGDYAWQLLRNFDRQRPGSYALLDKKALQLTGREVPQEVKESPYATMLRDRRADIFISYCTAAVDAAQALPGLTWARFADDVNVPAVYGIGLGKTAGAETKKLLAFLTGPVARAAFERHGFAL
jgi:molybdenum ABC transporter molybdate-binding protein